MSLALRKLLVDSLGLDVEWTKSVATEDAWVLMLGCSVVLLKSTHVSLYADFTVQYTSGVSQFRDDGSINLSDPELLVKFRKWWGTTKHGRQLSNNVNSAQVDL